jgi:dihydroneopterin aldolase
MSELAVEGIECYAHHGCLSQEAATGGHYVVDVYFQTDLNKAMNSDRLADTIDYVTVTQLVQQQMDQRSHLIEHVAGRILKALREHFPACHCIRVKVTKRNPPAVTYVKQASVIMVDNLPLTE